MSRSRRAGRGRLHGDRGAGSAEIVIAVPLPLLLILLILLMLLMLLILLVVQFAVWENAEAVAHAAADEALAAARVQGGTAASGQQRAAQVISQAGGGVLNGPRISVTVTAAEVTVQVTGTAAQVLPFPGLTFRVTATAVGPAERFVPDSRGFSNSEGLPAANSRVAGAGG